MQRIHDIDGIKIESLTFYGEQRFRFWVRSLWLAPNLESDGGMYRGIKEALEAAKLHLNRG